MDAHKNFAYSIVATAPVPPLTGLSLALVAGGGARLPTPPFNATVWPAGVLPLAGNAEIVRVTAIVGDGLTIVRGQELSTSRAILAGDQLAATITDKMLSDLAPAWIDIPYDGTMFTATGGTGVQTWTVEAGDQVALAYQLVGPTMRMTFDLVTTSVASTGGLPSVLRILIPAGKLAIGRRTAAAAIVSDNGVIDVGAAMALPLDNAHVWITKKDAYTAWAASVNNTRVRGSIIFEVG